MKNLDIQGTLQALLRFLQDLRYHFVASGGKQGCQWIRRPEHISESLSTTAWCIFTANIHIHRSLHIAILQCIMSSCLL